MPFESVKKIADADFPTRWGHFRILGYQGLLLGAKPCCDNSVEAIARKGGPEPQIMSWKE